MKDAACKDVEDPEIFFPEKSQADRGNEAIMICFTCPVRAECADYRRRSKSDYGIWSGQYTKRGKKAQ